MSSERLACAKTCVREKKPVRVWQVSGEAIPMNKTTGFIECVLRLLSVVHSCGGMPSRSIDSFTI
eukprot:COSAG02_NODE_7456_length_3006_cov_1.921913_2_plen_65_part_00